MTQLIDGGIDHLAADCLRQLGNALSRKWASAALDVGQGALRNAEMLGELLLRHPGGFARFDQNVSDGAHAAPVRERRIIVKRLLTWNRLVTIFQTSKEFRLRAGTSNAFSS